MKQYWVIAGCMAAVVSARAADSTWNDDTSGDWTNSANWSVGVPGASNSVGNADVASFIGTNTAIRTVTVDASRNVGGLFFSMGGTNLTLSGGSLLLSNGGTMLFTSTRNLRADSVNSPLTLQGDGGTATFTANGGTLTTVAFGGTLSGSASAGNTNTLVLNGTSTSSTPAQSQVGIGGIIQNGAGGGALKIVKEGTGVWTLTGNNTFTGGVLLNQGTLRYFGGANNKFFGTGTLTMADGTELRHANTGTNNIACAVTVNGNVTIGGSDNTFLTGAMDLGAATRQLTVTGLQEISGIISGASGTGLTKAGGGILTLGGANTYDGGTAVNAGMLVFAKTASKQGAVTVASGAGLGLRVGGAGYFSTTDVDDLWTNNLAGVSMDPAATVGIDTTPGSLTYATAQSTRGLTKLGPFTTLTLTGANSYSGPTVVQRGILKAGVPTIPGVSGAFGLNSAVTLINNGSVGMDITGYDTSIGSLAGGGTAPGITGVVLGPATLTLGGDGTSTSYAGAISGSGNLVKEGAGVQTFTAANSYLGTTTVNAGALRFNVATAVGGSGRSVTVNAGAGVAAGFAITQAFLDRIVLSSAGTIGLAANSGNALNMAGFTDASLGAYAASTYSGTLTPDGTAFRVGGGTATLTISSALADNGGATTLTKTGANMVTLSTASTYTGHTTVREGILNITSAGSGGYSVSNFAALVVRNTVTDGELDTILSAGTFAAGSGIGFDTTAGNRTYGGVISNTAAGALGLVKIGANTLTLTNANTYSGGTLLNGAILLLNNPVGESLPGDITLTSGQVQLGADDQIADAAVLTFAYGVSTRLQLQGFSDTIGGLQDSGGANNRIVEAAQDNMSNAPATLTLNVPGTTNYTFSGYVRNAAGTAVNSALSVTKDGAGTQTFGGIAGLVSYSGPTVINNGVLEFSGVDSVANNSVITINGGSLRFSGGGTRTTAIGGAGSLIKTGANTLTLSATNNTYSGGTTVSEGTLRLGADGALPSGGAVELAGGTLDAGTNTQTAVSLNVSANCTLNLGAGARLTFTGQSGAAWSGDLAITGTLEPTSVRFWPVKITEAQRARITYNGKPVYITVQGYLTDKLTGLRVRIL